MPTRKGLARRKTRLSLVVMACVGYAEVSQLDMAGRVKGYATTMCVLKKVNKFKFDLFSWICGGSVG